MERLRWRSRRGLLELDIVLERFWAECGEELDDSDAGSLATLLAMPDNDLLDLVMGRRSLPDPALQPLLQRLMAA
jgi:antitoxin CptB